MISLCDGRRSSVVQRVSGVYAAGLASSQRVLSPTLTAQILTDQISTGKLRYIPFITLTEYIDTNDQAVVRTSSEIHLGEAYLDV